MIASTRTLTFAETLDFIEFDIIIESSPTMTFLRRAERQNFKGVENVDFRELPPKRRKETYQTYSSAWTEAREHLNNVIDLDSMILQSLIDNESNREILGEPLYHRLFEVQEAFPKYIALAFLCSFFSDIRKSVGVALRDGNWETIQSALRLMEKEFYPFKDFDFDIAVLEEENSIDVSETFYSQVLDEARQAVLRKQKSDVKIEDIHESRKRWKDHFYFFLKPVQAYMEEKSKYVELYFSVFDTGIKLSLMNDLYHKKAPFASLFIDWDVPEFLLLENPFRILFPPLVCADREFSCNHTAPDKSAFPEYHTVEDVKNLSDEEIAKFSCSRHPGKLLLLLIRMNLKEMVYFCISNGLSVNLRADSGHCRSLKWKNDEANFEQVQEFGSKSKRELLDREFAFETPLSIAVEVAVYGGSTAIVERLLQAGANPLLCSDIAVKRAINAITLLATPRTAAIRAIPHDLTNGEQLRGTEIFIEPLEAKKPARNSEIKKKRRKSQVPDSFLVRKNCNEVKPVTATSQKENTEAKKKVAKDSKRIHSDSTGSSDTGSSGRPRRKTRNFAKKRERYKKAKILCARERNTRLEESEEYDLSHPEKVSLFKPEDKPTILIRKREKHAKEFLPSTSKEHIARLRASRTLRKILQTADNYKKIRKNHFTKVLLYQACIEGRDSATKVILESNNISKLKGDKRGTAVKSVTSDVASIATWHEDRDLPICIEETQGVLDEDNFELIVHIIDSLLNDGLKKVYPNYGTILRPIYDIMHRYKLYPNNWRFVQLFHIIKLAMKMNLAGDRSIILKFLELAQMKHYLRIEPRAVWEKVRFENRDFDKGKRAELKIEARTLSNSTELRDEDLANSSLTRQNVVSKETSDLDKLLKYATRMESLEIIKSLFSSGVNPAFKTADKMLAIAVKYQNTEILRFIYQNCDLRFTLTKAFIIALKGKYHHSMDTIFKLGFSIEHALKGPGKLKSQSTITTLVSSTKVRKQTSLTDARLRQMLTLFTTAIQDVLFERTVFDKDDGRRHLYGFTRQDEEETFYLIIKFIFKKAPRKNLGLMVRKVVTRAREAYECRIWFFGFHNLLIAIVNAELYEVLDDDFIEIYKLNYGQWKMYSREQEAKFRKKRNKEIRERARSRSRIRRSKPVSDSAETEYSPIDTEAFLTMATGKVRRTLRRIFKRKHERIRCLQDAVNEVKELVKCTKGSEKTPHDPVRKECRRSGSRNNDFISLNNLLNGSSMIL